MNWIHKWAIGIHDPEENLRPQVPAYTSQEALKRIQPGMTVRDGTAPWSLFLRSFARLRWIVLVGLSVVVRPETAQELELRQLPLPQGEFLTSPSIASPPSSDAEERQDPRPKSAHEDVQKGTSNDRILC